jgi:bifunctional DNA-binding transcriptional regulator/antitoxin component of YhaV-PrlF toxin-antitoxin module
MKEFLQIHNNGEITLPPAICRAATLQEGDLLEAVVEADGSIRLVPKSVEGRKLVEQSQLKDINWASKQKQGAKK